MKAIEVDPKIQANPDLEESVRRATELLEAELGPSSGLVSASWLLLNDDRGRPILRLAIWDWTGRVEAVFSPDEIKDAWHIQGRMIRLWGDLLQVRSHKLLDEMQAAAASQQGP